MSVDEYYTGQNAALKLPYSDLDEIPVSNVDWDRNVQTESYNQKGNNKRSIGIREHRYSGTFEYDGHGEVIRQLFWRDGDEGGNAPRTIATMTVVERPTQALPQYKRRRYKFDNVIVTGESHSVPSNDVATTTYNWVAEDVNVTTF